MVLYAISCTLWGFVLPSQQLNYQTRTNVPDCLLNLQLVYLIKFKIIIVGLVYFLVSPFIVVFCLHIGMPNDPCKTRDLPRKMQSGDSCFRQRWSDSSVHVLWLWSHRKNIKICRTFELEQPCALSCGLSPSLEQTLMKSSCVNGDVAAAHVTCIWCYESKSSLTPNVCSSEYRILWIYCSLTREYYTFLSAHLSEPELGIYQTTSSIDQEITQTWFL